MSANQKGRKVGKRRKVSSPLNGGQIASIALTYRAVDELNVRKNPALKCQEQETTLREDGRQYDFNCAPMKEDHTGPTA